MRLYMTNAQIQAIQNPLILSKIGVPTTTIKWMNFSEMSHLISNVYD